MQALSKALSCETMTLTRNVQYRGNQVNTEHALRPRRTSSTHLSSKVIQLGRWPSGMLLGLADSQKSSALRPLQRVTGFGDHLPLAAYFQSLIDLASTEP